MEDIKTCPSEKLPTKVEREEWEFKNKKRDNYIALARSQVIKKQILEAYEILDKIDFKYVSDTMFRDYISRAKSELEHSLNDFLMDEQWQKERIKKDNKLTLEEYVKQKNNLL